MALQRLALAARRRSRAAAARATTGGSSALSSCPATCAAAAPRTKPPHHPPPPLTRTQTKYQNLLHFVRSHGHRPRRTGEDKERQMCFWLAQQQRKMKDGALGEDKREKLAIVLAVKGPAGRTGGGTPSGRFGSEGGEDDDGGDYDDGGEGPDDEGEEGEDEMGLGDEGV